MVWRSRHIGRACRYGTVGSDPTKPARRIAWRPPAGGVSIMSGRVSCICLPARCGPQLIASSQLPGLLLCSQLTSTGASYYEELLCLTVESYDREATRLGPTRGDPS